MKKKLVNQDISTCGIYRATLYWDGNEAKVCIPGISGSVITTNKKLLPTGIFSSFEMRDTALNGEAPCWVTFENGDIKRPIIVGYFGRGVRSIGGTSKVDGVNPGGMGPMVTDDTLKKLLEYAYSKLGCKYVYGAGRTTSPDATTFDCSSFIYNCYAQIGINVGTTTYTLKDDGFAVDINELQPGDLIIWSSSPRHEMAAHVVMVYDENYVIHCGGAESGPSKVNLRSINWAINMYNNRPYKWVRRIVQVSDNVDSATSSTESGKKLITTLTTIFNNDKNIGTGTVVSYYYKNLKSNETVCLNQNLTLHAASLIKIFVMVKVFDCIKANKFTYDSVRNDLSNMITISDNNATNNLTSKIGDGNFSNGAKLVNDYAKSLGCNNTSLNQKLGAGTREGSNKTSTYDCALILEKIYHKQFENSDKMINLLKGQTRRNKIPAGLPSGIVCGNKTGETDYADNDIAIVYTNSGDYILCVMIHEMNGGMNACNKTIQSVSSAVYKHVTE